MPTPREIKQSLASLQDERDAAALYRMMADNEPQAKVAEVYRRLAATEERHAEIFSQRLREAGVQVSSARVSWQTRVLMWLAKRFGAQAVLSTLVAKEDAHSQSYAAHADDLRMAREERSHALLLQQIAQSSPGGMEGPAVARLEGRHRAAGGNALRAAVLGASDGLLANFNLVMGVAGASLGNKEILLTGLAGMLAGAISMGLGEWISVQSSRELYQKQIRTEKEEIDVAPEEELEELVLIYQARGLDEVSARTLAGRIMSNPETALDALVRDELGIDPEELGGSAWQAAITSFLLFAAGAALPVFPYLFLSGLIAIAVSATVSAAGLFVMGAAITLFTGRSVWYSGLRQVAFGLAAAGAVFLVGRLIGVTLTG